MAEKKPAKVNKAAEKTGKGKPQRGKDAAAHEGDLPEDLIETVLVEEDDPPAPRKEK
jgi:hypothetical protein